METRTIDVAGRKIGDGCPPFVIAEMSANHNGSLERALKIVDGAAEAGVSAFKIQTLTPDTMTLNVTEGEFVIRDPKSLWNGRSLHDLYAQAQLPWEWHRPIFDRCAEHGMIGFSTPFSPDAVDFLETLNVPLYKVASFENVDIPLIKRVAKTGKPMIISTGLASVEEILEAVAAARSAGARDIVLLKCTSAYPAPEEASNLATMADLRQRTGCLVGLSDHTNGIGVSVASSALGGCVIEKHFTLDRASGGLDAEFSLEPREMKALVDESTRAWKAVGRVSYELGEREKASLNFRRSLYIGRDVKAGERLTAESLRVVRPGLGLAPRFYEPLLGCALTRDARKGTAVTWDLFSPQDAENAKKVRR